ncbi:hypothetical protein [Marivita sp.]|uniref:hypothetical protein n=1 Tax=Marivita sp. TaxID=2003365 RepID=UPI0025B8D235|nr:hypothetical protein [Marivita sp.]
MKDMSDFPGRSVVGHLGDLPAWEATLILSTRLWMDGPDGQAEVWSDFARCFGPARGRDELRQFETFLSRLLSAARRPLVRHGTGCACIGSDEAVLRLLVHEAAKGDLAEAAMIASLILPAHHAEPIALMAARIGSAMKALADHPSAALHPPKPQPARRLH